MHVRDNIFFSEIYSTRQNKLVSKDNFLSIYSARQNKLVSKDNFLSIYTARQNKMVKELLLLKNTVLPKIKWGIKATYHKYTGHQCFFHNQNGVIILLFILGTTAFFRPKYRLHFSLNLEDHCIFVKMSSSFNTFISSLKGNSLFTAFFISNVVFIN